ncbi:S8 family serine peptidase [Thalassotalea nanhaiensis]|uniref:S8 family serine peptidase n=1 Tax=Thalassotalea nanhaiensis TaxID=3065648 RepID=A0ABY9TQC3_9GAMM|nr:S8 family serine peptidase [Colwelliaceae bacterium SQ345]
MLNQKNVAFKKTTLAALTALYFGATGQVVAEVGMKKVEGTTFYVPTFTAEDLKKDSDARKDYLQGDLFKGQNGRTNRHIKQLTAEQIFQPKDGVSGVQTYIVQLEHKPVATYHGDIHGLAGTAAPRNNAFMAKGRVNMQSQAVADYTSFLKSRQHSFISNVKKAGVALTVNKQFTVVNNAMVVEMTQQDAILMSKQSGVKRITENRIFKLQSDRGAQFIGADQIWDGSVSPNNLAAKGEGMVVGIIDTGINTDHVAFQVTDKHDFAATNPFGAGNFVGDCEQEEWQSLCNDKLIGVRSYDEVTVANQHPSSNYWRDQREQNGEDYNGHGSHTASTAAGNYIENTPLQTSDGTAVSDGVDLPFNFPSTSGVAPNAHIISYQVCWPGLGGADTYAGCPESAILSAFEDAISDGVDTINFSIGGAEAFPWEDPMELSFLAAREAGISVAAAAGNSGPNFWSADHASPWVTTVGASTHDRVLETGIKSITGFETDGDSWTKPYADIAGVSFSGGITGEVVLAANYPDPEPSDGFGSQMCNVPFPAGTFTADQIVICTRGDIARVDKAINVQAGGAGGLILQNTWDANNMVADNFVIPGIQVDAGVDWQLKNWVNNASPGMARATITEATNTYELDESTGNMLAEFSSMGPSNTNNTLVPDLTAPGVNIYAANADEQPFTNYPSASDWTMMSGTSMAAPHVTGAMTLLTQIHPEWSPAEIQSALAMTAKKVQFLHPWEGPQELPYNFMSGSGAIDVALAAKAGLVMDESYENYVDANPNNGGLANWLNTPSMVEMDCEQTCSWMRTVKATQDGSWNVAGIGKEDGVEITVSPASFTLRAGQTQSIMISAKLPEIVEFKVEPQEPGSPWEWVANNYWLFNGTVVLTEANGNAPDAHMPIVAANVVDQLPTRMEVEFSRNQASETFRVNTDDYSEFTPRYYGLTKPTETPIKDATVVWNSLNPYLFDKGWDIHSVEIPEGTKSVVFYANKGTFKDPANGDMNKRFRQLFPHIHVGKDIDGSGTFIPTQEEMDNDYNALFDSYYGEIICQSFSNSEENFCSMPNPTPGKYWFAVVASGYNIDEEVTMNGGYAIIMEDSDAGNITVDGPESHNGNGDYNLTLNWDLQDAKEGDVYYGGFDLGNTTGAEGTLGFTALKLKRGSDAVNWSVSQDKARSMDQIEVNVKVNANMETYDRDYSLNLTVPEGLTLVEGTLTSNNETIANSIVVDGNNLTLVGNQEATRNVTREYKMSTNLTSEMCHTPLIDEYSTGGYIDLHGEFGIQPEADWMVGDAWSEPMDVPIDWLFWQNGATFELYNQANAGYMRMHTTGALQFNDVWWMMNIHRGPGFLYEAIAPFWNGDFEMDYMRHWEDPRGLTIANQYASERPDLGTLVFLEYDNVTDTVNGDEYDFEVILRSGVDYHENMPEIVFAYDNLGANLKKGTAFVEGWAGAFSTNAGAKDGELYTMLGFDNMDEVLSDDLVICLDYDGPERSAVELNFIAVVNPEAAGNDHTISLNYELAGEASKTIEHVITVNGNIKVAELADMTVAEDSRIDDIEVMHVDANKVANVLEISGENITAEVDGMTFDLIPNADFTGNTEVFVTVRDIEHNTDATTTSFMLTVTPLNDMPIAAALATEITITEGDVVTLDATPSNDIDGDSLSFTWEGPGTISNANAAITEVSGLAAGFHEFTLTVTDSIETVSMAVLVTVNTKPTPAPAADDKGSSSGSFGWMLLFALPLLARARKQ